jgi:2-polyprenyl-3-methyl-5-hydroxy-6-metoxy-1,4-benzoquinol methylase
MINWLGELVQEKISNEDTVLDLGCGIQQANDEIMAKCVLGVDIWETYLNHIKDNIQTVKLSMAETDRFMDNSYDVVICLDVVEHLDKELALKVIDECKRIARKRAVIYTPSEFKDNMSAVSNAWNLGENPHQKHLCVLDLNDFNSRGYYTQIVTDNGIFAIWEKTD